ncbi:hypothetical protein B0J11DRAFT_508019 [Dendryphion nanum]|uniref:Uncharacterized protein n=1 Tax=Dendryphion nanum TaxID=256645 RepID=A0A9P9DHZ7_9PLEO|nr:hypothetical protein B0J11DRAFT_508019 [Dendryphion nanum]
MIDPLPTIGLCTKIISFAEFNFKVVSADRDNRSLTIDKHKPTSRFFEPVDSTSEFKRKSIYHIQNLRSNGWIFGPQPTQFPHWLKDENATPDWERHIDINEVRLNTIKHARTLRWETPDLVPQVCPNRLKHESRNIQDLNATQERVALHIVGSKFCLFIDGFDEYDGSEEEVLKVFSLLSSSLHIKICASGRPRTLFQEFFKDKRNNLDIAQFTKNDINGSIYNRLNRN